MPTSPTEESPASCESTRSAAPIPTATESRGPRGESSFLFGEDECVRWYTDLRDVLPGEAHLRAVAVQEGRDDDPLARALWLGGYDTKRIVELDPETGAVRRVVEAPVRPYGFALDRGGLIWIATREGARLGYLDPSRCLAGSSCACGANREGIACGFYDAPVVPYGIAVDARGRVWVGGEDLARYDPSAAVGARWSRAGLPFSPGVIVHGLAVDANGRAWAGGLERGVFTAGENLLDWAIVPGTAGYTNKGIAIDDDGSVWSVTLGPRVLVITPGATPLESRVETEVGRSLVGPYTYADMTGAQLRLATGPRGAWAWRATSCEDASWGIPVVDAEAFGASRVVVRGRVAATEAALASAPWATLASGVALSDVVGLGAAVEVEVVAIASGTGESPRLRRVSVDATCGAMRDAGPGDGDAGAEVGVDGGVEATDAGADGGSDAGMLGFDAGVEGVDEASRPPELALLGSRGCDAAAGGTMAWWWLPLLLARRRRRRPGLALRAVVLLFGLSPSLADAQARLERLDVAPAGSVTVRSGPDRHAAGSVRLDVSYARDPLRVVRLEAGRPTVTRVVSDQVSAQLTADLRVMRGVAVSFALPSTLAVLGHRDQTFGLGPSTGGLGDLRVAARGAVPVGPVSIGAELTWVLPTARGGSFVGAARHAFEGRALVGWHAEPIEVLLNAGVRSARSQTLGSLTLGSEALLALAVIGRWGPWSAGAELDGSIGLRDQARFRRAETSLEARAFVERALGPLGRPRLAVGTGVLDGWGTPSWRVVVGWSLSFGTTPGASASAIRARRLPRDLTASKGDRDGDGIADARDRCLHLAEDHDGVLDEDGCPEGQEEAREFLPSPPECVDTRVAVHFAVDVDDPSRSSERALRQTLAGLDGMRHTLVRVVGHADDRADEAYNDALSTRRIEAVLRVARDVLGPLPRVARWPRGEREPLVPGADPVARAQNRRVELRFECR